MPDEYLLDKFMNAMTSIYEEDGSKLALIRKIFDVACWFLILGTAIGMVLVPMFLINMFSK